MLYVFLGFVGLSIFSLADAIKAPVIENEGRFQNWPDDDGDYSMFGEDVVKTKGVTMSDGSEWALLYTREAFGPGGSLEIEVRRIVPPLR